MKLTKKERRELEVAKTRGYLIDPSRTRDDLSDAYVEWSEENQTPCIWTGRGQVWFFLPLGTPTLTPEGREELRELFKEYSVIDDHNEVDWNGGHATALVTDDREPLTQELARLIRKPGVLWGHLPYARSPRAWLEDERMLYKFPDVAPTHLVLTRRGTISDAGVQAAHNNVENFDEAVVSRLSVRVSLRPK